MPKDNLTMTQEDKKISTKSALEPVLDTAQVLAFLAANPEFLLDHPEALITTPIPNRSFKGDNISDFQVAIIAILRKKLLRSNHKLNKIIEMGKDSHDHLKQIEHSIYQLCLCNSIEAFEQLLQEELPKLHKLIVIKFIVDKDSFGDISPSLIEKAGILIADTSKINKIININNQIALKPEVTGRAFYGDKASLIQSEAIIRVTSLKESKTIRLLNGIVIFGAGEKGYFKGGQATDLIHLLANMIALCANRLLCTH